MAPTRSNKQASDQSPAPTRTRDAMYQKVPLKAGSPSTPHRRSPIKKRRGGITIQQKQALIDNLQLEITERARRLRAQYNLQAQGLRSRIEIRINRIPMALRKAKMGDLLLKCMDQEEKRTTRPTTVAKDHPSRPVPQKQTRPTAPAAKSTATRVQKRVSDAISGDKENECEHLENAKKRVRGDQNPEPPHVRPAQILSPTSSNSRLANRARPASPMKSLIARPASPVKNVGIGRSAAATNILSTMVEKAKATRAKTTRKVTAASNTSSSSNGTTTATRARRAVPARAPTSRPATRNARRVSANSETSEASTGTVVKRTAAARSTTATARKAAAAGATKKTTTTTTKAAASTTAKTKTTTGRVLRKRA